MRGQLQLNWVICAYSYLASFNERSAFSKGADIICHIECLREQIKEYAKYLAVCFLSERQ